MSARPCPTCSGTGIVPEASALRAARLAKGDPQKRVAHEAGVSIVMICDVEHGRRKVSPRIADAYRRLYGIG